MAVRAAEPPVGVVPDAAPRSSLLAELVRFSRRNTLAAIGGLVGVLTIVVALAAPLLAPYDPLKADFRHMNKPPNAQPIESKMSNFECSATSAGIDFESKSRIRPAICFISGILELCDFSLAAIHHLIREN